MLLDTFEVQDNHRKGGCTYVWLNEITQIVFPETV
jgi:hypothetical protein